jgi:hypothetical protein
MVYRDGGFDLSLASRRAPCIFVDIYKRTVRCSEVHWLPQSIEGSATARLVLPLRTWASRSHARGLAPAGALVWARPQALKS